MRCFLSKSGLFSSNSLKTAMSFSLGLILVAGSLAYDNSAAAQGNQRYSIVTGPVGSKAHSLGVGISSLVKIKLTPSTGIDLIQSEELWLLDSLALLDRGDVDFAMLGANWDDIVPSDGSRRSFGLNIGAVGTLWGDADWSIQLLARNDLDDAIVYEVTRTIYENLSFVRRLDTVLADTDLDRELTGNSLPLHQGALRYYHSIQLLPDQPSPDAFVEAPLPAIDTPAAGVKDRHGKTFLVFFGLDEAEIDEAGSAVLDDLMALGSELDRSTVWIAGYTDTSGGSAYNKNLSQRRVASVIQELRTRGIAAQEIHAADFGERYTWIKTDDEIYEARNRRVEIFVDPHDGPTRIVDLDRPSPPAERSEKPQPAARLVPTFSRLIPTF